MQNSPLLSSKLKTLNVNEGDTMLVPSRVHSEIARRRALGKVYALLIRLAEEKAKQTALPDNFGEETGKAEAQTPTEVENCND